MVAFVLRQNNAAVREICPACGRSFSPDLGPWPFVPASDAPLCADCATEPWTEFPTDRPDPAGPHQASRSVSSLSPTTRRALAAIEACGHVSPQSLAAQLWQPTTSAHEGLAQQTLTRLDRAGLIEHRTGWSGRTWFLSAAGRAALES